MKGEPLTGLLLDEQCLLTLGELSRACDVNAELIVELVHEGILDPQGTGDAAHWCFYGTSLQRARTAVRLQVLDSEC